MDDSRFYIVTNKKTGKIHSVLDTDEYLDALKNDKYLKVKNISKLDNEFKSWFYKNIETIIGEYGLVVMHGQIVSIKEEEYIIDKLGTMYNNIAIDSELICLLGQASNIDTVSSDLERCSIILNCLSETASQWGAEYIFKNSEIIVASIINDVRKEGIVL